MKNLIACLTVCVLSGATFADTWTVDDNGKADFNNIQAAIDAASDGDEIVVMPGTYTSTQYGHVVNMLGKALTLRSSDPSDPDVVAATIIDGESVRRVIVCFNNETEMTLIKGLTITNGQAVVFDFDSSGGASTYENDSGGGMYCFSSNPTIEDCIFNYNTTGQNTSSGQAMGAAIFCYHSDPAITRCIFNDNTAVYAAGGICCEHSSPLISNCTFLDNDGGHEAGGICVYYSSNPTITGCILMGNTGSARGGGIFGYMASATINSCFISENICSASGGGVLIGGNFSLTLVNTIICGNTPDQINGSYTDGGGNTIADVCLLDEDGDGVDDSIDNCYLYNPDQADCNGNGIGDICDIADQASFDCDQNSVPDECQLDCDGDGLIDPCDIDYGGETDWNGNDIPDNCEVDCNENGIPDDHDIFMGISQDCNENGIPDECDIVDGVQVPEGAVQWTIEEGGNGHFYAGIQSSGGWYEAQAEAESMGGHLATIGSAAENSFVYVNCASDIDLWVPGNSTTYGPWIGGLPVDGLWTWVDGTPWKYANWASGQPSGDGHAHFHQMYGGNPSVYWNDISVDFQTNGYIVELGTAGGGLDCNDNGLLDTCEIEDDPLLDCDGDGVLDSCQELDDCNANGIPDECDIADGTSNDVNENDIPDECEVDCNTNGVPDHWDIKTGTSEDCNANGIPDECDIDDGTSTDVNSNDVPDECEPDCNGNGIPDAWDIETGAAIDCNENGIPDSCDVAAGCVSDCNLNGVPDECDIDSGTSVDINSNDIPDDCECSEDLNGDGVVGVDDLLQVIGYWGTAGPLGDFNADNTVGVDDLLILISRWGECSNTECVPFEGAVQWPISEGGNGHWYRYNWDQTTGPEGVCWSEARERCLIDGGDLVSVSSQAESDFIQSTICPMADPGENLGWLGLMPDGNGALMWSNGEAVNWTNWDSGQPSGDGPYATFNGGCAGSAGGDPMTWNDIGGTGGCHISNETPLAFWITEWSN